MIRSLTTRIVLAFGVIILSVIVMSALVANWSAEHQLEEFVSDVNSRQSAEFLGILEIEFNLEGSLEGLDDSIQELQIALDEGRAEVPLWDQDGWKAIADEYGFGNAHSVAAIMGRERQRASEPMTTTSAFVLWKQAHSYVYHRPFSSTVKIEEATLTLLQSDYQLRAGEGEDREESHESRESEEEHGLRGRLYDWGSGAVIGQIAFSEHDSFGEESSRFSTGTLENLVWGGLITAILAFLISIWLAARINSPVRSLTEAAQKIAESGESDHLEISTNDELGKMSRAFNSMTDALKTQKNVRKKLIEDVSHELYTPLSVIRLEMKGMIDGMRKPEEAASIVLNEIELLSGLVSDLELISETENAAVQIYHERVEAKLFVDRLILRWKAKAESQNIRLLLDRKGELTFFTFDEKRIRQVLDNLIRNALQHTRSGGVITMTVSGTSSGLHFSVADSGVGVPAEHLSKIFERGYRIGAEGSGRGLGLSIAKQLVELHEGMIEVESELGKGSVFHVMIPRRSVA